MINRNLVFVFLHVWINVLADAEVVVVIVTIAVVLTDGIIVVDVAIVVDVL